MYFENRTCHRNCYINSSEKEKLFVFIRSLYGVSEISDKIKSQIDNFMSIIKDLTFADIRNSLYYFHNVQRNPVVARDTIGIVPKIYEEARNYFFLLKMKQNSFRKSYSNLESISREKIVMKEKPNPKKIYDIDSIVGRE